MSVTSTQLRPNDSGYLLGVLAHGFSVNRDKISAAKRQLVQSFPSASVLVPTGRNGGPLTVTVIDQDAVSEALLAFTDTEAAAAYFQVRGPGQEIASSGGDGPNHAAIQESSLASLQETGRHPILLNPAGPYGTAISVAELDRWRPRRFVRSPPVPVPDFFTPNSREQARARSRELIGELYAAVRTGDLETYERLRETTGQLDPIRSLELAAADYHVSGLRRIQQNQLEEGVRQVVYGVIAFAWFGFPERCIDAALESRQPLLAAGASAQPAPEWAQTQLRAVAYALEQLDIDWRRDEVQDFTAALRLVVSKSGD